MTYDPDTVTPNELIEMENRLSDYTKGLRNRQGGQDRSWRLFSLTAAHGCPSTHEEAVPNAETAGAEAKLLSSQVCRVFTTPKLITAAPKILRPCQTFSTR